MKLFLLAAGISISSAAFCQDIVNLVFVGDNGITENIKEAHSFIVVKKYPAGVFERLDYKMSAPLIMLRTYSDSNLENLEGRYMEYYSSGNLRSSGEYSNNLRQGKWYHYTDVDTLKVRLTEIYDHGKLILSENPDTVKHKDTTSYPDEREAEFKGSKGAWVKYLSDNINPEAGANSLRGGRVRVFFVVDTLGRTKDVYLKKSVEFVLDEESIRIIRASPKWIPAFQNGHTVNAFRIQPLTFMKE